MPNTSRMIPKVTTQRKDVISHFKHSDDDYLLSNQKSFNKPLKISKEIFELNNRIYSRSDLSESVIRDKGNGNDEKKYVKLFQKDYYAKCGGGHDVYQQALWKWIDFCKEFLSCYMSCEYFDFSSLIQTADYDSVEIFYADVDKACYVKKFVQINAQQLNRLVSEGKAYLFKIYNKDFSERKIKITDGKDNLETIMLKSLFSKDNIESKVIQLNGGAELFFRKASVDRVNDEKRSKNIDIVTHKRYTEDKYFFHFPITINFGEKVSGQQFRDNVFKKIKQDDLNIIGIDRGEKHLLYYSVVSPRGELLERGSLNQIESGGEVQEKEISEQFDDHGALKSVELVETGNEVKYVDYHVLLDYYEKKRNLARRDWQTIGKIKDLKSGYLSQVIHKICQLILKYDAIVVMEDLNVEFKAKRAAKVEKSVYKNFELALARKLNHLILKDKSINDIGGTLKAYQLTPVIPANDVGKFDKASQWGIMFYVRANYTSITDPLTGWRQHKYISNSDNIGKIQEFFNPDSGVQINYDTEKQCYRFSYGQQFDDNTIKQWDLFAYEGLERFYWDNKNRSVKKYSLYTEFEHIFSDLDKSKNINHQIEGMTGFGWKSLVFFWNLLNQIRNTDRLKQGDENDFLQSPAWSDRQECFYDSRKALAGLPTNGDANGAFNISRKGLILLDRIKRCPDLSRFGNNNNGRNPENGYFISDVEWDKFVQSANE